MEQVTALEKAATGMALAAIDDAAVTHALEQAQYAMGIVVDSAETNENATRALLAIQRGRKALDKAQQPIRLAVRKFNEAVAAEVGKVLAPLTRASLYLEQQIKARLAAEQQLAARLQREEEIRQADAKRKMEAAERAGKPTPPPAVQRYIPPTATTTRTEDGRVSLTHTLKMELVDPGAVPEGLLELSSAARAWMLSEIKRGELSVPKDGTQRTHRGIKVWYEAGLAKVVE